MLLPRVVLSLTTLPGRAPLLARTLASLRNQTVQPDSIYLWVPRELFRENCVPADVPGIRTRLVTDLGPATKLLPTLVEEHDPDTIIITVDDDVVYPPRLVERLVTAGILWPDRAIGFTGFRISEDGARGHIAHYNESCHEAGVVQDVHVLEGYRGVLYRRRFFKQDLDAHLERAGPIFRMHDDILLSGYLASRDIRRSVVWYGDGNTAAEPPWGLLGEDIGLHTGEAFARRGWAGIDYWQRLKAGSFRPIATIDRTERLQLNVAAEPRVGFLHHSADNSTEDVDFRYDLRALPWPWQDQQFREILFLYSEAALLPPTAIWLSECRRILKPHGLLYVRGPSSLEQQLACAIDDGSPFTRLPRSPGDSQGANGRGSASSGGSGSYWRVGCQHGGHGATLLLVRSQL